MRLSFAVILLTGVFTTTTAAWAAPPKCLHIRDIQSATSDDGRVMKFVMRDGKVLYNYLQGACPNLRFNGFVWVVRGTNVVCEDQQSLRVLESGQVCVLGKFGTTPKPPMSKDKKPG
jgi:hypothetical protein